MKIILIVLGWTPPDDSKEQSAESLVTTDEGSHSALISETQMASVDSKQWKRCARVAFQVLAKMVDPQQPYPAVMGPCGNYTK